MSGIDKLKKMYSTIDNTLKELNSINKNLNKLKDVYIVIKNDVFVKVSDLDTIKNELENKMNITKDTIEKNNQLIREYEEDFINLDNQIGDLTVNVEKIYKNASNSLESKDIAMISKLNPNAKVYLPSKLNPKAKEFNMQPENNQGKIPSKLNPKAKEFNMDLVGGKKNRKH